jgi:hypothetical protein
MLDAGMAEFAAEMQAKARLRRPRPAARRADELDNLSAPGAQRLCQIIKSYWSAAGFANVQTEIVHSGGTGEAPVWGIQSDMIGGLPAATGGRNSHA